MSKSDNILVTGATGFVGANLVRRLVSEGYKNVHITTRKNSNKWRLSDVLARVNEHDVDILKEKELKQTVRDISPDVIFHLANAGLYGGVHLPDKEVIETNFLGTVNLINASNDIDYKCFINTGSSSEYGPKNHPMKETDICEPINVYGISKCAATLYGNFVARTKDKPIVGLRIFSPFGPYDDKKRLMTYAITAALQNRPLMLANPNAVRDYIYVKDILDLYLKGMELASKFKGEIFNVGSGSQKTVSYVVKKIFELTKSKSDIKWNTFHGREHDAEKWEADIEKVSKCFNWRPKYRIDDGIKETVVWFKNNLNLYV